jgi:hypothetical protein
VARPPARSEPASTYQHRERDQRGARELRGARALSAPVLPRPLLLAQLVLRLPVLEPAQRLLHAHDGCAAARLRARHGQHRQH